MKRMKWFTGLVIVLFAVFLIAGCRDEGAELLSDEDAYVTLDINPSVELIVSPRDTVVYADPLNEDGELLLLDLALVGLPIEEAVDKIIAEAIALGFIDTEDEEIVVSVDAEAKAAEVRTEVLERIKEHVDASFRARAMIGRAITREYVADFLAEAESYGVTPGFLRLAKKAVLMSDELTLEEALELEHEDLIELLREKKQEQRAVAQALKEDFMDERNDLIESYQDQIIALEQQIEEALEDGDVDELVAQLEALRQQLKAELEAFRDEYRGESEVLFMELQQQRERRRQEHEDRVADHLERIEERREAIQDRIDRFQNRDDDDEDNPGKRP
ncbi:MAG: hypothetical protein ACLFTZ_05235 [Acholeplasmataceae bacterium]